MACCTHGVAFTRYCDACQSGPTDKQIQNSKKTENLQQLRRFLKDLRQSLKNNTQNMTWEFEDRLFYSKYCADGYTVQHDLIGSKITITVELGITHDL